MVSEARTIELKIVSATDLKKIKKFGRAQRCYVVAYIYPAQRQATDADLSGGVSPFWNAPVNLTCYEADLYPDGSATRFASSSSSSSSSGRAITIDIYSHSTGVFSSGDKLVGSVVVPLQYIASAVPVKGLAMSFDVRRPSGRIQGKLNLTVKLGDKRSIGDHSLAPQQHMPSYAYYDKVTQSPMMPPRPTCQTSYYGAGGAQSIQGVYHPYSDKLSGPIVTGYPSTGYAYDPLGQLRVAQGNPQQFNVNRQQGVGPYVFQGPMTRKERKQARRARKAAMTPAERKARNKRRRNIALMIVGGVILGLILI